MGLPPPTTIGKDAGLRLALVWASVLVGPLAYLAALATAYFLVEEKCRAATEGQLLACYGAALVAVALAAAGGWRVRRTAGGSDAARIRTSFLAACGLLMCAFSALLLVGTALPVFTLRPCE
jgi:hypothetical protein